MPHLSPLTSHFSPPPAALPYNSALSLWLSVDPLADKYPSTSPYTYCANNPVRLVDVDGRSWETPEDEEYADELKNKARQEIVNNTKAINTLKLCIPKSAIRDFMISDFEERNSYLSEGIKGLENMGNNQNCIFHFVDSDKKEGGYVTWSKASNLTFVDIHGDGQSTFWHESKHIQDWLSGAFNGQIGLIFGLITKDDGTNVLGTARTAAAMSEQLDHFKQQVEKSAYRSEFSFDPSDFFNGRLKPAFLISHINGDMKKDN